MADGRGQDQSPSETFLWGQEGAQGAKYPKEFSNNCSHLYGDTPLSARASLRDHPCVTAKRGLLGPVGSKKTEQKEPQLPFST